MNKLKDVTSFFIYFHYFRLSTTEIVRQSQSISSKGNNSNGNQRKYTDKISVVKTLMLVYTLMMEMMMFLQTTATKLILKRKITGNFISFYLCFAMTTRIPF